MKTYLLFTLILLAATACKETTGLEASNSIQNDTLRTKVFYLDYHYEEEPEKVLRTVGTRREIYPDSSFCLLNYTLDDSLSYSFKTCFDQSGNPTGSGTDEDFKKIYDGKVELNFRGVDTVVSTDTKQLINPTELWFWKTKPNRTDSVIVKRLTKNFITNSIDTKSICYKYLGFEELTMGSTSYKSYKIKTWTIGKPKDVFDLRWYNDQGMMIKELHYVGKSGLRIGMLRETQ